MSGATQLALEALKDVAVEVSVRLGQARVPLGAVLLFAAGTVVSLECLPDAPAVLMVNGVEIATGDLVIGENGMLAVEIGDVAR